MSLETVWGLRSIPSGCLVWSRIEALLGIDPFLDLRSDLEESKRKERKGKEEKMGERNCVFCILKLLLSKFREKQIRTRMN